MSDWFSVVSGSVGGRGWARAAWWLLPWTGCAPGCALGSCAADDGDCALPPPCEALAWACDQDVASVATIAEGDALPLTGPDRRAAAGDLLLRNRRVAAVIDALDEPHGFAPSGGTIIDLAVVDGADQLNGISVAAGVLPADAFDYRELRVLDQSPARVAVLLRGRLHGRPEVKVATRYELRACDVGVRVRSELYNGSPDPLALVITDVAHWGGRGPLPFSPVQGQGFLGPDLLLTDLASAWSRFPFVAARAATAPPAAYAVLSCDRPELEGVNDPTLSALGTPRTLVRPGEGLALERYWIPTPGPDVESAAALAQRARRALHGGGPARTRWGRVDGELLGDERFASVVVAEALANGQERPWTEAIPDADGRFAYTAPAGAPLRFALSAFGRDVASAADARLTAPPAAHLAIGVTLDGAPADALVVLVPADPAEREGVAGSLHGRSRPCAPYLGPPHGGSPACDRALVRGLIDLPVPPGRYHVLASAGPGATLARAAVAPRAGESLPVELALHSLPIAPPGWAAADLHVHGAASPDAQIPDADRVLSFAAAGIEVVAATDHDVATSYEATIDALGLAGRVVALPGVETTPAIPFFDVPGERFPRVVGHFNFWPVAVDPARPRGGVPWDELAEPGELFARMDAALLPGGVRMVNHPWAAPVFGRDLGYFRAVGYDPRRPIPDVDDGTREGVLARGVFGGPANLDFDVVEVINGPSLVQALQNRQIWFSLLSQGKVRAGAGNSDSHDLSESQVGWPRTWVRAAAPPSFDAEAFNRAVKAGRMTAGHGVFIDATIGPPGGRRRGVGVAPAYRPAPGDTLDVEVRAAPWIPVGELRVIVNGRVAARVGAAAFSHPRDPFGRAGVARLKRRFPLAALLPPAGDAWLLVEAGLPLPPAADLDDDGIVDTGDNDGDGVADARDLGPGREAGPLADPADPSDPADPRFWLTRVAPGTWPLAFTNPWCIDRAGDGWTPPGLP